MTKNAYIHIPFCKQKCKYCSFISSESIRMKQQYLKALLAQIKKRYKGEKLETIYIGGGTPSLLNKEDFDQILGEFNFAPNPEITVECNPESINSDLLAHIKTNGVNRISLGVQTFDEKILKQIGRIHTAQSAITAVKTIKDSGYKNFSLDLIYGLPNQSIKGFEQDLMIAISLSPTHISLYGLKIEEGCFFYNAPPKKLPNDEKQAEMYLSAIKILTKAGFEHYEISNFAKPGHESNHNLTYWKNKPYYGFGLAASGYQNNIRYTNESNLKNFINDPLKLDFEQELNIEEQLEEEIFLGLRQINGIDTEAISSKFSIDFNNKFSRQIDKFCESKHLRKTDKGYALTTEGILVSNTIFCEFLAN